VPEAEDGNDKVEHPTEAAGVETQRDGVKLGALESAGEYGRRRWVKGCWDA
jgi:hypothetical protein